MNDAVRSRLAEDLAVARALAEQGRRAPLVGGSIYVVRGVIVALCLGLTWAIETRLLPVSYWTIPWLWFLGMGSASLLTWLIRRRLPAQPGAVGVGNTVTAAVWTASGVFLGAFASALFLAILLAPPGVFGLSAQNGPAIGFAFSIFLPVSFGVYAVAMAASAEAAQSRLLKTFSRISFVAMIITAALIGRSTQMLVGAIAVLVVLAVPGLALMRQQREG